MILALLQEAEFPTIENILAFLCLCVVLVFVLLVLMQKGKL